jgi:hypothetical protein
VQRLKRNERSLRDLGRRQYCNVWGFGLCFGDVGDCVREQLTTNMTMLGAKTIYRCGRDAWRSGRKGGGRMRKRVETEHSVSEFC